MRASPLFLRGFGAIALLGIFASGCGEKTVVTPNGTVVIDWDQEKATRVAFRGAKIVGSRASKDYRVTFTDGLAPLTVTVHVETATVEYTEGTSEVKDAAPVAIKVTVAKNDDWNVSGKCQEGPSYNMPGIGKDGGFQAVPGIIQDCDVHYDRTGGFMRASSWQLGTTLNVESAKPVTLFPAANGKVESM